MASSSPRARRSGVRSVASWVRQVVEEDLEDPQVRRRHLVRRADRVRQLAASIAPTRSRFSPPQTTVLDMSSTSPSRPERLGPCLRPPCLSMRLRARVRRVLAFATRSVRHLG